MKPRLYVGPLSNRVFLATRYRERGNGLLDVTTKYDVTNEVGNVIAELDRRGLELRPVPRTARNVPDTGYLENIV